MHRGFLRTAAPWTSDVVLVLEFGMGLALLAGAALARRGRFRAHAWCQSLVVMLNLLVILLSMLPSFRHSFPPPASTASWNSYYILAGTHAALGTLVELLALYILLVAGTNALPERWRFRRYKTWMRAALLTWWATMLLGVATYLRWYILF